MNAPVYLSAREAAAELGVQPATLYAYVSRGLIRSVPGPGKQRRYDAADVRALQTRRDRDQPREISAELGAGGSTPALETRLTLITEDGPYYRGHLATELAESSTLETVATLLWNCDSDPFHEVAQWCADVERKDTLVALGRLELPPLERVMARFSVWPLLDRSAQALAPNLLASKGARLLYSGIAELLGQPVAAGPLHEAIAKAWGVSDPAVMNAIRMALVLCADHELNTSAYAVRCAASTRAPLHACLLAGLGAFAGPRHGSHSDRVLAWLRDVDEPDTVESVLLGRLNRGEDLPGFGHILYSSHDPRAELILKALEKVGQDSLFRQSLPQVVKLAREFYGLGPNIDFALVALQRACLLPMEAPKLLFCAGRLVGWIAHAIEQYQLPEQIRPRATYLGPRPSLKP